MPLTCRGPKVVEDQARDAEGLVVKGHSEAEAPPTGRGSVSPDQISFTVKLAVAVVDKCPSLTEPPPPSIAGRLSFMVWFGAGDLNERVVNMLHCHYFAVFVATGLYKKERHSWRVWLCHPCLQRPVHKGHGVPAARERSVLSLDIARPAELDAPALPIQSLSLSLTTCQHYDDEERVMRTSPCRRSTPLTTPPMPFVVGDGGPRS